MADPIQTARIVDEVALGMTKEIGWGSFDQFDPNDMRRVAQAALSAAYQMIREEMAKVADGWNLGRKDRVTEEGIATAIRATELAKGEE